jgi:GTPase SAR1 family protein
MDSMKQAVKDLAATLNKGTIGKTISKSLGYSAGNGNYFPVMDTPPPKAEPLPSGIYQIRLSMLGPYLSPTTMNTEKLLPLDGFVVEKVLSEIKHFWSGATREKFSKWGLTYKRGILLYGPPGTGKTSAIIRIMSEFVRDGGVVIFNSEPGLISGQIKHIRECSPETKILVVFEEMENLVRNKDFLTFLDGEDSCDNVLTIATTNYLDQIPPRIKSRPSRFATVIEVGTPGHAARETYIRSKITNEADVLLLASKTQGLVLDQIKDVIINTQCFGIALDVAIQKTKELGYEENDKSPHLVPVNDSLRSGASFSNADWGDNDDENEDSDNE